MIPLVPARLSTWQEPHFCTKACLPATWSASRSLTEQAESTREPAATASAAVSARTAGRERARRCIVVDTNRIGPGTPRFGGAPPTGRSVGSPR